MSLYRSKTHPDQFIHQYRKRWFINVRVCYLNEPDMWYWSEVTFPLKDDETMEDYMNKYWDTSSPLEFLLVTGFVYKLPNPHRPHGLEQQDATIQK